MWVDTCISGFVCMRGVCVRVCRRVFECGCMQVFLCVYVGVGVQLSVHTRMFGPRAHHSSSLTPSL